MKLTIKKRTPGSKSQNKEIRRAGNVPAVLYSKGEKGQEIVVEGIAFKKILNTTPTGTLSSKVFELTLDGKKINAIVKDIQYNIITYDVIHIDFEELHKDLPVNLNIPIQCININDCAGVKLGGVIRQVVRHIPVSCLPKDIPSEFEIDVRDMGLGQMKKLSVLTMPKGVRPRMSLKEVAIIIARK